VGFVEKLPMAQELGPPLDSGREIAKSIAYERHHGEDE
jgi:hypothetical protein